MRVHFLGATGTTTGSMFLFEVNGRRFLLECGLYQGRRGESIERNRTFPFNPREIDAVVLSHAHIDHCGNLPNLCKQGFGGNIYCTFATRDLASILLEDSAHIQAADAQFVSKKRAKKSLPPVQPLYSAVDADKALQQFVALNYERPFPVVDGVTAEFFDAGHILGSAQVALNISESGRRCRYLFSGDVGRGKNEILRDPVQVEGVDILQIESTYGGRLHAERTHAREEAGRLVLQTIEQKGLVIIPAFSVGRTQQIVYELHRATDAGYLPQVPIYVDSPLSVNATEVYRLHPECFNEEIYRYLREKANPFGMENLTYIREVAHSMKLNDLQEPAIIISASGMCEAGRILHHLKNHIGDPKNLVLFIGFCAEHTLGAQILSGRSPVTIFDEPHVVRARIASLDAYSGHADQAELQRYASAIKGDIRQVMVVHGEPEQSRAFAAILARQLPTASVVTPEYQQVIEC